jgi:chromosome segregation ATPase
VNKQLNERKENTNKQINEIKKTMQERNRKSIDMGTMKNNQSEINNSISHIKISFKSLENRVEKVVNTISGTEDKVEALDQAVKDHERMLRKYEDICDTMKRKSKPTNHGCRRRRGDIN